ncbi:hypothetical protein [Flindersiella endophytica]
MLVADADEVRDAVRFTAGLGVADCMAALEALEVVLAAPNHDVGGSAAG